MKVKIHKWQNIVESCGNNQTMLKAFMNFRNRIHICNWEIPSDILNSFQSADIIACLGKAYNRVIFNVGGKKYRLICGYKFGKRSVILYIRFVGSHSEYDKVDPCEVNMF